MSSESFPAQPAAAPETGKKTYFERFSLSERIEHAVLLLSFSTLGITGLPQKYANQAWAEAMLRAFGGIETARAIHHVAAIILMAVSIYHIVAVFYRIYVVRRPLNMLPTFSDFTHLIQDVMFYLGRRARKAYYGRYNYAEKMEYLAVVWGTVIMAITGFMMWNPIATTRFFPGETIPAAKAAHGGEALLAVLAIILWHFYHVHIKHFNKSMFTGKISRHEMEAEHPAELAQLEAAAESKQPSLKERRRREQIYLPIAAVLVVGLSFGLYRFVTLETTAITTVPQPEKVNIFVPITPTPTSTPVPTPTPPGYRPIRVNTWEDGAANLFSERCGACHVEGQSGGLSLATYQGVLQGGSSGPAVVPGDPQGSKLVQVQSAGGHPGQLSSDELTSIINWIKAGAPEK